MSFSSFNHRQRKSNYPAIMSASIRSALNLQIAAPIPAILLSKNKKRLKKRSFLRRVKQTRGTTQIAKILFRHLFEVQQLLCTDVAYTGNAYWVIDLWGFRLRRDGNSTVLYRAHTTPDSLENSLRIPSSSTPLRIAY